MKLSEIFLKGIQFSLNTGLKSFERKTVSRLMEHIDSIEEEKHALLQHIESEMENQKLISVPLEVAEAIEYYKLGGYLSNWGIMNCIMTEPSSIATKARIAFKDRPDIVMAALVNGYTLETVESKIADAVQKVFKDWREEEVPHGTEELNLQVEHELISKRITEVVKQIIREDQAFQ